MSEDEAVEVMDSLYKSCSSCLRSNRRTPLNCGDSCFPLMQQALDSNDDVIFDYFYKAFEEWMLSRARSVCFRFGVTDERAEDIVNDSYSRFWQSLRGKSAKLNDFGHGLKYLYYCTRSVVLASAKRPTTDELEEDRFNFPGDDSEQRIEELWQLIVAELGDQNGGKDLLLADCYLMQGLKPRQIVKEYSHWDNTEEIRVAWQHVRRQLRRNYAIRQWFNIHDTI